MNSISEKTIERLILYQRFLRNMQKDGVANVYSHQLAKLAGVTAAQVRRDFMVVDCLGSPVHGYEIKDLIKKSEELLDSSEKQEIILVGIGNLGRALLTYLYNCHPKLQITAVFDNDPQKTNRVIYGCRCYPMESLVEYVKEKKVTTAIITVPGQRAQEVAEELVESGIRGILNFAPERLNVPAGVFVENIDMTTVLEKIVYFASQKFNTRT